MASAIREGLASHDASDSVSMTWSTTPLARRATSLARWLLLAGVVALAVVPDEAILRPKMVWGRGLVLAAACVLLAATALAGRIELRWRAFLAASLLPAAVALARGLLGPIESAALARDELGRLALLPLAAWTTAAVLDGPRWRQRFVIALSLAGLWVGAHAVLQRVAGLVPIGIEPASRSDAGFGNPVFLGAWLAMTTPMLLAEAMAEPGRSRWPAAVAAGLCLPALLGSGSAGAWLALAVALLVGVLLVVPASRALNVALAAGGAAIAALLLMHPNVLLRPRTHGLIWRDTLGMFLERPWGVGPGQFQLSFLPFASDALLAAHPRSSVIINDAHCEALQIAAELGWPGLLAMLWVISTLAASVKRVLGGPAERARDAVRLVAALAGAAGCVAQSFVSPDLRFQVTTVMLGILLGFAASFDESESLPLRGGRPVRLVVLLAALLGLGGTAWAAWDQLSIANRLPPTPALEVTAEDAIALARLRELADKFPDDPASHYELATALGAMRRYEEAAESMRRAHGLAPDNPATVRSLGVLEGLAGHFDAAVPLLEASLSDDPSDIDVRYLLAFCSFGRGDVRTAIRECEAVLADSPEHARARLLLERLRE